MTSVACCEGELRNFTIETRGSPPTPFGIIAGIEQCGSRPLRSIDLFGEKRNWHSVLLKPRADSPRNFSWFRGCFVSGLIHRLYSLGFRICRWKSIISKNMNLGIQIRPMVLTYQQQIVHFVHRWILEKHQPLGWELELWTLKQKPTSINIYKCMQWFEEQIVRITFNMPSPSAISKTKNCSTALNSCISDGHCTNSLTIDCDEGIWL